MIKNLALLLVSSMALTSCLTVGAGPFSGVAVGLDYDYIYKRNRDLGREFPRTLRDRLNKNSTPDMPDPSEHWNFEMFVRDHKEIVIRPASEYGEGNVMLREISY